MVEPTTADIQEWSLVEFAELGFADIQVLIDRAVEYVQNVTGRTLAAMPTDLEKTAQEAIQRTVEQAAHRAQEDLVETAADFDLIQAFSVTGYSETRRGVEDAMKAKMINLWPLLHDLLWRLATPDKQDEWEDVWGANRPAFEVTEVDWSETGLPDYLTWPGA